MNDWRTRDLFARQFTEWRTQVNTFKFIKEVHNCPAVRDLSSIAYKDTKNKQKKIQEVADKLSFVQTFLFLHPFLFLVFSSAVSLFYVSATALRKSAVLEITVCRGLTRV